MSPNRPTYKDDRIQRSLFRSEEHYVKAEKMLDGVLTGKIGDAPMGDNGEIAFSTVLDIMGDENKALDYMDYEHLVELYLRHSPLFFNLAGDDIVSLRPANFEKPVVPPDTLYFGTVRGVAQRALEQGLESRKHPHVVLTSDITAAVRRSHQFSMSTKDEAVLLTVDAGRAYKDGKEFLVGNRSGLYMATHISRKYLTYDDSTH